MARQKFEKWATKYVQTLQLSDLGSQEAKIGVDASYYLNQCLNDNREEPLKVALGGLPFTLTARIQEDLHAAKEAGVDLVFVFDGLDFANKSHEDETADTQRAYEQGWTHYLHGDPKSTVQDFGKAEYPLCLVHRYLRKVVHDAGFQSMIAPFSATAWLAYLYHLEDPIDAILSSPDAFLFGVDKVILSIDSKAASFNWLTKSDCIAGAGNPSPQVFQDAQLLLGSQFLQAFPPVHRNDSSSIKDALNLLNRGSPLQLCNQFREDPSVAQSNWAEKYKKAIMTIRHHVIITPDGAVEPMDIQRAPGEVHAFVGQRLPDELFFYISRGLLDPQVPNWLATGEVKLKLPGGALDSESFRRLTYDGLNPLRISCVKLLAESLHFYWQAKHITIRSWDGRDLTQPLKEIPSIREKMTTWKVQESSLLSIDINKPFALLSCLRAISDKDFAGKMIAKGRVEYPALKTQREVVANTLWRFLHIRQYVDDKHQLTSWGKMLEASLANAESNEQSEDHALLAVELLRFGLLNTQSPVGVSVLPSDAAAEQKRFTNLLSKIGCLGRLRHDPVGYVGPLDRGLLTFAWEITYIREMLRDLMETIMVTMFLNGEAARERSDWQQLTQKLPLVSDNGSSLGIAIKSYFDVLNDRTDKNLSLEDLKEQIKAQKKPYEWFSKAEGGSIGKSLDSAFYLFDAVNAAVKAGGKDVKDAAVFESAKEWLSSRR